MSFRHNRIVLVSVFMGLASFAWTSARAASADSTGDAKMDEAIEHKTNAAPIRGGDQFQAWEEHENTSAWAITATGEPQPAKTTECDERSFGKALRTAAQSHRGQLAVAQSFMAKCRRSPAFPNLEGYYSMYRDGDINYDYLANRNLHYLQIPNEAGLITRTRLALQPGTDARPLIIVKCGMQCNLGEESLKQALMMLFDEGPFHVLLVPSVTGSDWQIDNGFLALGGYDEGRQLFNIARYLQSPEFRYRDRVSSVHVIGFSLGGGATLYSALYNDANPRPDGGAYIQSVFAGCPAVDLEKSVRTLYSRSAVGMILGRSFWKQIGNVFNAIPILGAIIPDVHQRETIDQYPGIIEQGALNYYQAMDQEDPEFRIAPLQNQRFDTTVDFWHANQLENYLAYINKTPTFIWASTNDPIVHVDQNSVLVKQYADAHPNSPFQVLITPQGSHCAFRGLFGWRLSGEMIRNYFLSRSPDLATRAQFHRVSLSFNGGAHAWRATESLKDLSWAVDAGQNTASLHFNLHGTGCPAPPRSNVPANCDRVATYKIPLNLFHLPTEKIPGNKAEAEALTRWFNANVTVTSAAKTPVGARENPAYVEWTSY